MWTLGAAVVALHDASVIVGSHGRSTLNAELLSSDISLVAAGLAGLAMTTIAILRDLSATRSRMASASSVSTRSSATVRPRSGAGHRRETPKGPAEAAHSGVNAPLF